MESFLKTHHISNPQFNARATQFEPALNLPPYASWTHKDLIAKPGSHGQGVFTTKTIPKNTIVAVFNGIFVGYDFVHALDPDSPESNYTIQVDDDRWLTPPEREIADYFNHSCEPNCGFDQESPLGDTLVTMRDIENGEELTYDYGISEGDHEYEMHCVCGAPACRKIIRHDDWQSPDLQKKYKGWFSPFLRRKIEHNEQNRQKQTL